METPAEYTQNTLFEGELREEQNSHIEQEQQEEPQTISEKFMMLRQNWTAEIENLNSQLKTLPEVDKLLNTLFTKRQNAVNLYYGTYDILMKQSREYKVRYSALYNSIKQGANGIRYTNETSINTQIEAQLVSEREIIDELKNFTDFMWETVKSIDAIQFAVSNKIKIHEILNGIKY